MPQINQNLADVSDDDMKGGGWRAFENGEYTFQVVESDYRETHAGNGHYLLLVWECMEPGRSGKIFDRLTLDHPNEQTVRIARAKLKCAAIAVGHRTPDMIRASEELHNKPAILKLKKVVAKNVKGDDDGYTNEILDYKPLSEKKATPPPKKRSPSDFGGGGPTEFESPPYDDKDAPPF